MSKTDSNKSSISLSAVGIIIALGFAGLPISNWVNEFADVQHLVLHEIVWWSLVALVIVYVLFIERRRLDSIGFKKLQRFDILIAALGGVIITIGLAVIYFLVFPALHLNEDSQVNTLLATPLWWRIISVIRAGVSEEILFRGYGLERLKEISGSVKFAAFISWLIFTLEHIGPWAWSHVLIAGFGGLMLTGLYLWRQNLWVNIIAHIIVDAAAVLA